MAVYVVTGKLGAGKSLVAVGKIKDKLQQGCKVATNLDIYPHELMGPNSKRIRLMRIPDKPTLVDLEAIGTGTDSYDESKNGLLVLDECGTWFNSRSWADKSRQQVINWFLHARKLGWDIIFLIQDMSIMDKQARVALAEHVVYCRRLDRATLPLVGPLFKFITGSRLPLPKLHMGIVRYGDSPTSMIVDRWTYTGRDLYSSYDTKQAFSDDYDSGTYTLLPPWLTHGMWRAKRDARFYMKLTRIYWKRFNRPLLGVAGFALGAVLASSVLLVDAVGDANAAAEPEPVPDLSDHPGLRITSYARFGDYRNYQLVDANGDTLTSRRLESLGHRVVPRDACSFILNPGTHRETIRC